MKFNGLRLIMMCSLGFLIFLASCSSNNLKIGETYHGFKLVKKEFVKEVNSDCYYFEHLKSGARLLKIANDDPNKTFCATFKTLPSTDCGTPHILEHSVLNGSKNFPVKSPFDVLAKGSLKTFLNAMTGGDITLYPVASMNDKDFQNLMNIYLDAVFFPRIYDDPRIFKQEGWHYELTSEDEPIIYKGVVYNEMKGSFSSPDRELGYHIDKNLFPDNCYKYSSGGYPETIPKLSREDFLNFHSKFYHPTNSYLYLYGNSDIQTDLEFIDREYLSQFEKLDKRAKIEPQKPFDKMKKIVENYPISESEEIANKTFLALDWVIGDGADQVMSFYLDILSDALVNHESGPIKLALQEAGIGQDVSAFTSSSKQNVFQITVKNANLADLDKFHNIVTEKLNEVASQGIDKDVIEGIVNRMEFRLREGDNPQKGLTYLFQSLQSWFYAGKPFESLKWEKPLAAIKEGIANNRLEELIKIELLNNNHKLLTALTPKPGLQKARNEKILAELAEYKKSLSKEEKEALIKETNDLIAFQQEKDSEEDLATIPLLKLEDIGKNAEFYAMQEKDIHGTKVLHYDTFTNNIIYTKLLFDAQVIKKEELPYLSLLAYLLGSLNTENYSFGELDNELNKHTGGFSTYITNYLKNYDDQNMQPKFIIDCKAMNDKTNKIFDLTKEIITKSKFDDKERLKVLLTRHQSRQYANVMGNGIQLAMTRLSSYHSSPGKFNELTNGYTYYQFITNLKDNFDEQYEDIVKNLTSISDKVFNQKNLIAAVTCSNSDFLLYKNELHNFAHEIPNNTPEKQVWDFDFKLDNEGLMTTSKVQYVTKGFNYKKLGYEYNGKMLVMNQILSRGYLTQQIRIIGGAYGGFCGFSKTGNVYFASYRDPNLKKTLENIDGSPEYLKTFAPTEDEMTRYIIGTISRLDQPKSPSQQGNSALNYYMYGFTKQDKQNERDAVLATTVKDINEMADFVQDILDNSGICVYGNEEKIKSQKELFKSLIQIK